MTRRGALTAVALLIGALSNWLEAQEKTTTNTGVLSIITMNMMNTVHDVRFDLRAYKSYTFTLDGQRVTFTPEQIMEALR